ncbi:MAG: GGDEF domain-containing protein, partial [Bradyrhizobium sp.]|nr:GGDEF domain-containing protein [Bradyrhizobium sp.]
MSQQGPLLLVSNHGRPAFAAALDEAQMFPLIETDFADAMRAVAQVQPSAVLAGMSGADGAQFAALAAAIDARKPYLPLIAINAEG